MHPKESKAKRMAFAEKILECASTTGLDDETIASAMERAIKHYKGDTDPTIYYATTPKVLGYWLVQDEDVGFESVHQTEYAPGEAYY